MYLTLIAMVWASAAATPETAAAITWSTFGLEEPVATITTEHLNLSADALQKMLQRDQLILKGLLKQIEFSGQIFAGTKDSEFQGVQQIHYGCTTNPLNILAELRNLATITLEEEFKTHVANELRKLIVAQLNVAVLQAKLDELSKATQNVSPGKHVDPLTDAAAA